jgi:hypothetical protein
LYKEYKKLTDAINYSTHGKALFIVAKVSGPGTYKLMTEDGEEVKNTWHISQLRRFYA